MERAQFKSDDPFWGTGCFANLEEVDKRYAQLVLNRLYGEKLSSIFHFLF